MSSVASGGPLASFGKPELLSWARSTTGVLPCSKYDDLRDGLVFLALLEHVFPVLVPQGAAVKSQRSSSSSANPNHPSRRNPDLNWDILTVASTTLGLPKHICDKKSIMAGHQRPCYNMLVMFYFLSKLATSADFSVDFTNPIDDELAAFLQSPRSLESLEAYGVGGGGAAAEKSRAEPSDNELGDAQGPTPRMREVAATKRRGADNNNNNSTNVNTDAAPQSHAAEKSAAAKKRGVATSANMTGGHDATTPERGEKRSPPPRGQIRPTTDAVNSTNTKSRGNNNDILLSRSRGKGPTTSSNAYDDDGNNENEKLGTLLHSSHDSTTAVSHAKRTPSLNYETSMNAVISRWGTSADSSQTAAPRSQKKTSHSSFATTPIAVSGEVLVASLKRDLRQALAAREMAEKALAHARSIGRSALDSQRILAEAELERVKAVMNSQLAVHKDGLSRDNAAAFDTAMARLHQAMDDATTEREMLESENREEEDEEEYERAMYPNNSENEREDGGYGDDRHDLFVVSSLRRRMDRMYAELLELRQHKQHLIGKAHLQEDEIARLREAEAGLIATIREQSKSAEHFSKSLSTAMERLYADVNNNVNNNSEKRPTATGGGGGEKNMSVSGEEEGNNSTFFPIPQPFPLSTRQHQHINIASFIAPSNEAIFASLPLSEQYPLVARVRQLEKALEGARHENERLAHDLTAISITRSHHDGPSYPLSSSVGASSMNAASNPTNRRREANSSDTSLSPQSFSSPLSTSDLFLELVRLQRLCERLSHVNEYLSMSVNKNKMMKKRRRGREEQAGMTPRTSGGGGSKAGRRRGEAEEKEGDAFDFEDEEEEDDLYSTTLDKDTIVHSSYMNNKPVDVLCGEALAAVDSATKMFASLHQQAEEEGESNYYNSYKDKNNRSSVPSSAYTTPSNSPIPKRGAMNSMHSQHTPSSSGHFKNHQQSFYYSQSSTNLNTAGTTNSKINKNSATSNSTKALGISLSLQRSFRALVSAVEILRDRLETSSSTLRDVYGRYAEAQRDITILKHKAAAAARDAEIQIAHTKAEAAAVSERTAQDLRLQLDLAKEEIQMLRSTSEDSLRLLRSAGQTILNEVNEMCDRPRKIAASISKHLSALEARDGMWQSLVESLRVTLRYAMGHGGSIKNTDEETINELAGRVAASQRDYEEISRAYPLPLSLMSGGGERAEEGVETPYSNSKRGGHVVDVEGGGNVAKMMQDLASRLANRWETCLRELTHAIMRGGEGSDGRADADNRAAKDKSELIFVRTELARAAEMLSLLDQRAHSLQKECEDARRAEASALAKLVTLQQEHNDFVREARAHHRYTMSVLAKFAAAEKGGAKGGAADGVTDNVDDYYDGIGDRLSHTRRSKLDFDRGAGEEEEEGCHLSSADMNESARAMEAAEGGSRSFLTKMEDFAGRKEKVEGLRPVMGVSGDGRVLGGGFLSSGVISSSTERATNNNTNNANNTNYGIGILSNKNNGLEQNLQPKEGSWSYASYLTSAIAAKDRGGDRNNEDDNDNDYLQQQTSSPPPPLPLVSKRTVVVSSPEEKTRKTTAPPMTPSAAAFAAAAAYNGNDLPTRSSVKGVPTSSTATTTKKTALAGSGDLQQNNASSYTNNTLQTNANLNLKVSHSADLLGPQAPLIASSSLASGATITTAAPTANTSAMPQQEGAVSIGNDSGANANFSSSIPQSRQRRPSLVLSAEEMERRKNSILAKYGVA